MNIRLNLRPTLLATFLSLALAGTFAQSPPQKRKKIKNFGSSLKRLKWNPQKNAAVEIEGGPSAVEAVGEDDVIRIDTSLVTCELLVLDEHGKNVSGLTEKDFLISEDGAPQTVGHFLLGDNVNVPRTIVLIIDYSGSQMPYFKNSVEAAKLLVNKLAPNDRMAIVTDDVDLLVDFTGDKKKLKNKLESLMTQTSISGGQYGVAQSARRGKSMQYSALMATLNEAFEDFDVRPIVVFQTDGDEAVFLRNPILTLTVPPNMPPNLAAEAQQDVERKQKIIEASLREFSLDDVYRAVERSRATVYTIVPGPKLIGLTPDEQIVKIAADNRRQREEALSRLPEELRSRLKRTPPPDVPVENQKWKAAFYQKLQAGLSVVAAMTGGWTEFLETPAQASDIYTRIFSDINQRYIIGYYPTNKEHDGKRRKIDFSVKDHPGYQILGRRTYFAPAP